MRQGNMRWTSPKGKGVLDFETRHRPLFILTMVGESEDQAYEDYLEKSTVEFFVAQSPNVLVYDGSHARMFNPRQRSAQAQWLVKNHDNIVRFTLGVAFVMATPFQRGLLTAVHWLAPPIYEYKVLASRSQGIEWALETLMKAGIAPPSAALDELCKTPI